MDWEEEKGFPSPDNRSGRLTCRFFPSFSLTAEPGPRLIHKLEVSSLDHHGASKHLIYMIQCRKCKSTSNTSVEYIWPTKQALRDRFEEHSRAIPNKTDNSVPQHFNQPGHQPIDIELILLEPINTERESIRRARERFTLKRGKLFTYLFHYCYYILIYFLALSLLLLLIYAPCSFPTQSIIVGSGTLLWLSSVWCNEMQYTTQKYAIFWPLEWPFIRKQDSQKIQGRN